MNIQDYMTRQRGLIERQSRYVKAYRVFDFSYVPSQPMIRPETKQLVDDLLRFELTGVPSNALVLGSRGSGKTLTLKHLCEVMPKQSSLVMRYVNCRHHNTSHRILAHLLGGRCQGLSLGELYQRFMDTHAQQRLCLVLDEVDLMSPKDRRREVLYLLSRSETPVMLILLSNNHKVTDQLDAATRSSLQLTTRLFRNYTPEQIEAILKARAEAGLRVWDAGSLRQIAALTVRLTHADARVAIKTLFYLVTRNTPMDSMDAKHSEPGKQVNPRESAGESAEHTTHLPGARVGTVAEAFESARHDIVQDMVQDLSDALLLILRAVVNGESRLAKDTYARYCRFSKEMHEPPFSYVHYYASLAYLQSCGLVALISTKTGRAYTNRVEATFDGKVVEPIVKARFG